MSDHLFYPFLIPLLWAWDKEYDHALKIASEGHLRSLNIIKCGFKIQRYIKMSLIRMDPPITM